MDLLSYPLDVVNRAMQGVFGRAMCFALACMLGRVAGAFVAEMWRIFFFSLADDPTRVGRFSFHDFVETLLEAVIIPVFGPWFSLLETAVTGICCVIAFAFIRLELSAKWLLLPFLLMLVAYVHAHAIW